MLNDRNVRWKVAIWLMSAVLLSACGESKTKSVCGNRVVETGEQCDPPDGTTCDTSCKFMCGNGVVDSGETCDTAITSGSGACPTSCDDGSVCTTDTLQNGGTCTATCTHTTLSPCCGNGTIEVGEDCEPPDTTTCDSECKTTTCVDQRGTWITRITTTGTITAPDPVNTLTGATIDVVQRMVISKVGDNYSAQFEICSLSTTANKVIPFSSDYSAAVLKSMSGTATSPYVCYKVNDTVTLPSFTINTGWGGPPVPTTNACPSIYGTKPWPPAVGTFPTSCSGAVDTDGDGVFGISLPTHLFNGAINLVACAGLTMNITLNNMVLTDATTNTGTTSFPTVGYIFGSTSGALGNLNVVPDSSAVPVTAIKLAGDVPCATVLTHCTGATCVP